MIAASYHFHSRTAVEKGRGKNFRLSNAAVPDTIAREEICMSVAVG
jgi:hypothetical protein